MFSTLVIIAARTTYDLCAPIASDSRYLRDGWIDGRSIDGLCEPGLIALVRWHRTVFIIGPESSGFLTSCFVFPTTFSASPNLLSVINDLFQFF